MLLRKCQFVNARGTEKVLASSMREIERDEVSVAVGRQGFACYCLEDLVTTLSNTRATFCRSPPPGRSYLYNRFYGSACNPSRGSGQINMRVLGKGRARGYVHELL